MAEKLSVQIALEGGQEIERQLAGIGAAGQKAFAEIEKSASQVGGFKNLKPEEVTQKLKTLGVEGTAAFDKIQQAVQKAGRFEKVVQGVQALENSFASAAQAAMALGRVAGPIGVVLAAGATLAVKAMGAYTEALDKAAISAAKLGTSVEQADKLRKGIEALGVSGQGTTSIVEKLADISGQIKSEKLDKAIAGVKEAVKEGGIAFKFDNSQAVKDLQEVQAAAMKADADGAKARATLKEIGQPIPAGAAQTLKELVAETGSAEAGLAAFQKQLLGMTDATERNAAAVASLGQAAPEFLRGLETAGSGLEQTMNRIQTSFQGQTWLQFFQQLGGGFAMMGQELAGFASQLAGIAWNWISTNAAAAWQAAIDWTKQAQAAIVDFASSLPSIAWDTITTNAAAAWAAVKQGAADAKAAVLDFASSLPGIAWEAFKTAGLDAINAIIDRLKELLGLKQNTALAKEGGGGAPGKARGGLIGGRGTGTSDSNLAWLSRGEHIMPARVVRQPGVLGFLEALRRSGGLPGYAKGGLTDKAGGGVVAVPVSVLAPIFNRVIDQLKSAIDTIKQDTLARSVSDTMWSAIKSITETLSQTNNQILSAIRQMMQGIINMIVQAADTLQTLQGKEQTIGGKARGGLLGGRGTGTSDSNLAWLSRGEYVTPARAVRQPGVLALLEALRRSGGNLSRVLDGMGRFALGGLVPRPMPIPAYAAGGMVGGANLGTLTLGLPSGGSVSVRAASDVVDQLRKEAALAQVRSGGRKPSRYS